MKENMKSFFPSEIYSAEAVELAAYIYEDKVDLSLENKDNGVEIIFKNADESLLGEFGNEVLNQQCRIDLSSRTSEITSLIVSKALLSAIGGGVHE
ncbi:MAG: His-Xaa-Ser system protein HxsD [Elusimicrobiales bacterium]|nr:His-Xaa-Ser system protein HxsD [Elusimicrobiales bacterium]